MKYPNGDVYDGALEEGKRNGKGTMTYFNGDKYEGDWLNDLRDGEGNQYI